MKRFLLLIANILIIAFVIAFVTNYARHERTIDVVLEKESFENITYSAELVTTNYLEGEQRTCNSWANYMNARDLTIEQAIEYVRVAKTNPKISGHIIKADTLTGLSTNANPGAPDDYSVSYKQLPIFHTVDSARPFPRRSR